ncbi:MAG TPA: hypothetical protein VM123_16690 [archaeon]|nr:hypothetical protein [archaeon]
MKFFLSNRQKVNLLAASFGASSIIVQTEFLRGVMEAAAGGTLAVGAALGAWMCWIALGALAGGWLARIIQDARKTAFFISALALPCALFPVLLLASIRLLLGLPGGELIPFDTLGVWSALACGPHALLVGLSFPIFAKLSTRDQIAYPSGAALFIGGLWAAEAAGAFFAGVFFTLILAGRTSPLLNVTLFGSLPLLLSSFLGFYPGRFGKLISTSFVLLCLVVFILVPSLEKKISLLYWQGLGSPGELLSQRWTRYCNLVAGRLGEQTTFYDDGYPVFNFPDPYYNASQAALLLSQHPKLSRILVVGTSAGGLAQALISSGAQEVVSVYPDKETERELMRYLPGDLRLPLESGAYRFVGDDARAFLGRPPARDRADRPAGWDMLLLNLDGPSHMNTSRYYTPGFFRRASRAFGPAGGVVALRLPIGANVMLPAELDQVASVWASLKQVFPYIALGLNSTHCYIFAASADSLVTQNLEIMMARVQPFEGKVPLLTRYILPMYFDSTRTAPLKETLQKRSIALGAHTDSTPVAWLHYLRLWARLARQAHGQKSGPGLLERVLESAAGRTYRTMAFWPAIILSFGFLLIWLSAVSKGKITVAVRWAAVLSIAATGFAAMGATVTLIYLCQLVFGALFYQVAMITATFMFFLAAGSSWASKRASVEASSGIVVAFLAFLVSVAVCLPTGGIVLLEPLIGIWGAWGTALAMVLFYLMVAAVGLFCGALFPWTAALHGWAEGTTRTDRTAAALDCADHLGAAAGALTVGVFAVPALGISAVGSSLALGMICVALFWFAISSKEL